MNSHAGVEISEFEKLILTSANPEGTALILFLCWIAASDGDIDEREHNRLTEIANASKHGSEIQSLFQLVEKNDINALQLSCEILKEHSTGDRAELYINLALGVALADGYFPSGENHIVRFLADAIGISPSRLGAIFMEMTGKEYPEPSDLSSAKFWRDSARKRPSEQGTTSTHDRDGRISERHRALAVLGLDDSATVQEIRGTFRRLSMVHHPDRYSAIGPEAVAAATETFRRIKTAYDYLINNA